MTTPASSRRRKPCSSATVCTWPWRARPPKRSSTCTCCGRMGCSYIDLGEESGFELSRGLGHERVILISTHAEADFEELIVAGAAVGFIPKEALSADAISATLGR